MPVDSSTSSCLDPNKVRTRATALQDERLTGQFFATDPRRIQALPQRVRNVWTGGWDVQTVNGTQASFWDVQPGFNIVDCQLQTSSCRLYRTARHASPHCISAFEIREFNHTFWQARQILRRLAPSFSPWQL